MAENVSLGRKSNFIPTASGSAKLGSLQFKVVFWAGGALLLAEAILIAFVVLTVPDRAPDWTLKLIAVTSALFVAIVFGGWRMAAQITEPLGRMIKAVNAMAQGDCAAQVDSASKDEIGQLAEGICTLANRLSAQAQQEQASKQALLSECNLLHTILDALPDRVYAKDLESRYILSNQAHWRLVGARTIDQVVGKTIFDLFPKEMADQYYADDQATMRSGEPLLNREEVTMEHDTGKRVWNLTSKIPFRDSAGKVIGLIGISRDISERKEAEATLAIERNLLHALLDTIPDAVTFKDAESRYLRVSKAKALKHGLKDPSEAVGKTDRDFFGEEHFRAGRAGELEIMRTGEAILNVEEKQKLADGSDAWVLTSKMPLCDADGKIVGTYVVSRTITKQKQFEESLERERDGLKAALRHLEESAVKMTGASAEILASSTQMAATTREQASAVNQVTSTVTEIKVSAEQVAQRAQSVAEQASRASEAAKHGTAAVGAATAGMEDIRAKVEAIAANILALSEQTQQIGEIIDTVTDIAGQSNILALNAAIEAARAGEAGKGFRVVADEVRSLAGQSRQAAQQVKVILGDIQKATNLAVMATEQGTKGVQAGSEQISRTAQTIQELARVVEQSAQSAQQIVAGVEQQTIGLDQIEIGMNDINQAAQQSAAGAAQSQKAAQDLNDLSAQLKQVVVQYKM